MYFKLMTHRERIDFCCMKTVLSEGWRASTITITIVGRTVTIRIIRGTIKADLMYMGILRVASFVFLYWALLFKSCSAYV